MQKDKLQKLAPVVGGVVLLLILVSLISGGGVRQSTPIEAAQTFVQALITGDDAMMDAVNRSGPLCHPTFDLMAHTAPRFAGYSLRDFTFTEKGNNIVVVASNDGVFLMGLEIVPVGKRFYFIDFRRQR